MRIHEGNFAYEVEQQRDQATQLLRGWKFTVFRLHPAEMVISQGEAQTREQAEAQARKSLDTFSRENSGHAA